MTYLRLTLAFGCACAFLPALAALAGPAQHTITATLNYDFTADNACTATATTGCVKQFNIYDLSGPAPAKLFSIAAPSGANGPVTGITGTSAALTLRSGSHTFGAAIAEHIARAIECSRGARLKLNRAESRAKLYERELREDRAYSDWAYDLLDDSVPAFHQ